MFLYDKTNILEGVGIFEIEFAPSHGPATATVDILIIFRVPINRWLFVLLTGIKIFLPPSVTGPPEKTVAAGPRHTRIIPATSQWPPPGSSL